ncbi:MAG: DUF3052 domain-containing protein [Nocardioidaceae bacterium]
MAGYSGTPLMRKIGVREGQRVCLDNAPEDVDLTWPAEVQVSRRITRAPVHIAWTFCYDRARLERRIVPLIEHVDVDGMVWVSWPKRSSGLQTDLDENSVRAIGLAAGVVDVKVAAVDDTWSALKFVRRRRDRNR